MAGTMRDHRRDGAVVRGRARHQEPGGGAARARRQRRGRAARRR